MSKKRNAIVGGIVGAIIGFISGGFVGGPLGLTIGWQIAEVLTGFNAQSETLAFLNEENAVVGFALFVSVFAAVFGGWHGASNKGVIGGLKGGLIGGGIIMFMTIIGIVWGALGFGA